MEILASLLAYANPPFNYLGSTLFLSYILLALFFTFGISILLYSQYKRIPSLKLSQEIKDARTRHIKIYAFLASISFAILSYNMLSFLIQSLTAWARMKNLMGIRVGLLDLGNWTLETNLFESFAQELVRKRPGAVWTQVGLLGTWFWNVWMAYKAQQHKFSLSIMAPYIVLSQILPITFTACLFVIQLHLDAMGISPNLRPKSKDDSKAGSESKADSGNKTPQSIIKKSSLALPTVVLNAAILALPSLKGHPVFIPLVFFTRIMLLVPHTARIRFDQKDVLQCVSISFGFVVANLTMLKGTTTFLEVISGVRKSGFAVKTLGYDAELSLLVGAILRWGGGV
ncbi:hypothetical protein BU23DRAFT_591695 [Bimuria novae-zelandiae CBS 107.79]|uniref:Uncharacterized protein n=1 Tax=Bimuria novae-zelandiae CBS 107.79 TaxID=1447943 RepID=A0A6A5UWD8_9PLEO|nr:hypothetical protein BU23DRAFT_591695 [Bimuria novae-zelandiae CBS 107.79]